MILLWRFFGIIPVKNRRIGNMQNLFYVMWLYFSLFLNFSACFFNYVVVFFFLKKVVGLERGPLRLVSTTEELLDIKVAAPV
jgi:hypothetical protein